jgi:hypothetical protein
MSVWCLLVILVRLLGQINPRAATQGLSRRHWSLGMIVNMDMEKLMGLLMITDATFNISNFSSGNSYKEAFAIGAPVMT